MITLDGVRWQDVLEGSDPALSHSHAITARDLLPNLYSNFVDHGIVIGKSSEMDASGPNYISLPGYLEILRGHPAHDCQVNECIPHKDTSILDYYHQWYPSAEIAVMGSWDQLRYVGNTSKDYIINIGHFHQNYDAMLFPFHSTFGDNERDDSYTEASTNLYLQDHSPDFLWVALGDTDEYAHMGSYPDYLRTLRNYDRFIGQLIRDLPDDTTFIITTDHGRGIDWRKHGGSDPTSKRVWMMLRGPHIPHKGMVDLGQPITSSWIYPTIQGIIDRNIPITSVLSIVQ